MHRFTLKASVKYTKGKYRRDVGFARFLQNPLFRDEVNALYVLRYYWNVNLNL